MAAAVPKRYEATESACGAVVPRHATRTVFHPDSDPREYLVAKRGKEELVEHLIRAAETSEEAGARTDRLGTITRSQYAEAIRLGLIERSPLPGRPYAPALGRVFEYNDWYWSLKARPQRPVHRTVDLQAQIEQAAPERREAVSRRVALGLTRAQVASRASVRSGRSVMCRWERADPRYEYLTPTILQTLDMLEQEHSDGITVPA